MSIAKQTRTVFDYVYVQWLNIFTLKHEYYSDFYMESVRFNLKLGFYFKGTKCSGARSAASACFSSFCAFYLYLRV